MTKVTVFTQQTKLDALLLPAQVAYFFKHLQRALEYQLLQEAPTTATSNSEDNDSQYPLQRLKSISQRLSFCKATLNYRQIIDTFNDVLLKGVAQQQLGWTDQQINQFKANFKHAHKAAGDAEQIFWNQPQLLKLFLASLPESYLEVDDNNKTVKALTHNIHYGEQAYSAHSSDDKISDRDLSILAETYSDLCITYDNLKECIDLSSTNHAKDHKSNADKKDFMHPLHAYLAQAEKLIPKGKVIDVIDFSATAEVEKAKLDLLQHRFIPKGKKQLTGKQQHLNKKLSIEIETAFSSIDQIENPDQKRKVLANALRNIVVDALKFDSNADKEWPQIKALVQLIEKIDFSLTFALESESIPQSDPRKKSEYAQYANRLAALLDTGYKQLSGVEAEQALMLMEAPANAAADNVDDTALDNRETVNDDSAAADTDNGSQHGNNSSSGKQSTWSYYLKPSAWEKIKLIEQNQSDVKLIQVLINTHNRYGFDVSNQSRSDDALAYSVNMKHQLRALLDEKPTKDQIQAYVPGADQLSEKQQLAYYRLNKALELHQVQGQGNAGINVPLEYQNTDYYNAVQHAYNNICSKLFKGENDNDYVKINTNPQVHEGAISPSTPPAPNNSVQRFKIPGAAQTQALQALLNQHEYMHAVSRLMFPYSNDSFKLYNTHHELMLELTTSGNLQAVVDDARFQHIPRHLLTNKKSPYHFQHLHRLMRLQQHVDAQHKVLVDHKVSTLTRWGVVGNYKAYLAELTKFKQQLDAALSAKPTNSTASSMLSGNTHDVEIVNLIGFDRVIRSFCDVGAGDNTQPQIELWATYCKLAADAFNLIKDNNNGQTQHQALGHIVIGIRSYIDTIKRPFSRAVSWAWVRNLAKAVPIFFSNQFLRDVSTFEFFEHIDKLLVDTHHPALGIPEPKAIKDLLDCLQATATESGSPFEHSDCRLTLENIDIETERMEAHKYNTLNFTISNDHNRPLNSDDGCRVQSLSSDEIIKVENLHHNSHRCHEFVETALSTMRRYIRFTAISTSEPTSSSNSTTLANLDGNDSAPLLSSSNDSLKGRWSQEVENASIAIKHAHDIFERLNEAKHQRLVGKTDAHAAMKQQHQCREALYRLYRQHASVGNNAITYTEYLDRFSRQLAGAKITQKNLDRLHFMMVIQAIISHAVHEIDADHKGSNFSPIKNQLKALLEDMGWAYQHIDSQDHEFEVMTRSGIFDKLAAAYNITQKIQFNMSKDGTFNAEPYNPATEDFGSQFFESFNYANLDHYTFAELCDTLNQQINAALAQNLEFCDGDSKQAHSWKMRVKAALPALIVLHEQLTRDSVASTDNTGFHVQATPWKKRCAFLRQYQSEPALSLTPDQKQEIELMLKYAESIDVPKVRLSPQQLAQHKTLARYHFQASTSSVADQHSNLLTGHDNLFGTVKQAIRDLKGDEDNSNAKLITLADMLERQLEVNTIIKYPSQYYQRSDDDSNVHEPRERRKLCKALAEIMNQALKTYPELKDVQAAKDIVRAIQAATHTIFYDIGEDGYDEDANPVRIDVNNTPVYLYQVRKGQPVSYTKDGSTAQHAYDKDILPIVFEMLDDRPLAEIVSSATVSAVDTSAGSLAATDNFAGTKQNTNPLLQESRNTATYLLADDDDNTATQPPSPHQQASTHLRETFDTCLKANQRLAEHDMAAKAAIRERREQKVSSSSGRY